MSTRRALAFSFLDRYAALVVTIGSSMVISRLLSPAEIGVFSVTMVLLTFITALRDMGAGQYLVQERSLTPEKIRAAWTVSLATGAVACIIVLALSVPVALFYDEPRMTHIMWLVAANFAINPFGSLTYAWLMREMKFESLAAMRFLSSVAGAAMSIALAWQDFGPISLAFGTLASTLVNGVVASLFRPRGFPLLPAATGLGQVFNKGSKFSGSGLVAVLGGAAPELILGKLHGLAAAAIYSRANGLALMFQRLVLDATNVVAVSHFAKSAREGRDVAAAFLQAMSYVTVLGWAFFLSLALLAAPAIYVLYGNQWGEAIPATRTIAIACLIGLPGALCPTLLLGLGEATKILNGTLVVNLVQALAIAMGAVLGGVEFAARGLVVASLFALCYWLIVAQGQVAFGWARLARTLATSSVPALAASLGAWGATHFMYQAPEDSLVTVIVAVGLGVPLFVGGLYLIKHPLTAELGSGLQQAKGWFMQRIGTRP